MAFSFSAVRKFLLLLLFSAAAYVASAQTGRITGKVVEAGTGAPIDFAVVGLTSGSGLHMNTMSNNGGAFAFSALSDGDYRVIVSFIGYHADTVRNIRPDQPSLVISLRKDNRLLNEVTISETRPLVEYEADRIIYNAEQSLLSEGSVATDLLRNVPMVDVDPEGRPSIAGKRNTRIFINGKPSDYTASAITDLLNVLPSESILRIEVISSPPARYSADGEGIINIELKKDFHPGLTGSLSGSGSSRGNYNGNGFLTLRTGHLKLTSNAGLSRNNRLSGGNSIRETFRRDTTHYLLQDYANRTRNQGRHSRSSLDWDITPLQNIRVALNLNAGNNEGSNVSEYEYRDEDLQTARLRTQNNDRSGSSSGGVLDADYTVRFARNKEEKLTFGINYARNAAEAERASERAFFLADGSPDPEGTTWQHQDNETQTRTTDMSIDYDRPFRKEGRSLEAGMKLTHTLADHLQLNETADPPGSPDPDTFRFRETTYAGYAAVRTKTWLNLGIRAGLRAEVTDRAIAGSHLVPYMRLFPTIAVSRYFLKKYHAGLTYGMRINRPRANVLNPQVDDSDPANLSYGNPGVRPSVTHQVELSFGTFRDKWSLSPRIAYADTRDIIERVRTVGDDGISRSTWENMSGSRAYSFHLSGVYRPTKKIRSTAGLSISRRFFDSENQNLVKRNGTSFRTNLGISVQLPKRLAFESDIRYSDNVSAQGSSRGYVTSTFSARKSVWNNRLSVRMSARDPFYGQHTREISEGRNFRLTRSSETETGNFSVALSYRFIQNAGKEKTGRIAKNNSGESFVP